MSNKSTKFTLEIKGIELPEKEQAEISKALNETLMHKLGHLDLARGKADDASSVGGSGSPFAFAKILINGGWWEKVMSAELTNTINELQKQNNIPSEGLIQIQQLRTM